jgi:hypothetical protein
MNASVLSEINYSVTLINIIFLLQPLGLIKQTMKQHSHSAYAALVFSGKRHKIRRKRRSPPPNERVTWYQLVYIIWESAARHLCCSLSILTECRLNNYPPAQHLHQQQPRRHSCKCVFFPAACTPRAIFVISVIRSASAQYLASDEKKFPCLSHQPQRTQSKGWINVRVYLFFFLCVWAMLGALSIRDGFMRLKFRFATLPRHSDAPLAQAQSGGDAEAQCESRLPPPAAAASSTPADDFSRHLLWARREPLIALLRISAWSRAHCTEMLFSARSCQ